MRRIIVAALVAASATVPAMAANQTAIFAGGCFWSVETDMDKVPGVVSTVSGYSGGSSQNPTYENHSDHREAVQVTFDPAVISYPKLVDAFWHSIDPTDAGGQICDRGHSYTTAIYTLGDDQAKQAAASLDAAKKELAGQTIATEVLPAGRFWEAEGYHQDYAQKNPAHYKMYRVGCGRDNQVKAVWGESAHRGIAAH